MTTPPSKDTPHSDPARDDDLAPRPAWKEAASLLFGKGRAADTPRAEGLLAVRWFRDGLEFVRFLGGAAVVYLILTTFVFRTFYIPSSSMEPTLEVQDRVFVLNFAYGFSRFSGQFGMTSWLPACEPKDLKSTCRIFGSIPRRGDVVVFRHPCDRTPNLPAGVRDSCSREHLIKRVIGHPGDVVEMREGRLFLNGQEVPREREGLVRYRTYRGDVTQVMRYAEMLPDDDKAHPIYEAGDQDHMDNVGPFTVKPGHLFVMGDNRDNSNDSRAASVGQIPMERLVGRAITVLFTFHSCEEETGLSCANGRVWRGL